MREASGAEARRGAPRARVSPIAPLRLASVAMEVVGRDTPGGGATERAQGRSEVLAPSGEAPEGAAQPKCSTEGAGDESIRSVNEYIARHRKGAVECRALPGKGRVLVASRRIEVGEPIFRESPLHVVWEEGKTLGALRAVCDGFEEGEEEVSWYLCALCSLTVEQLAGQGPMTARKRFAWRQMSAEQQARALLLHQGDRAESSTEIAAEIARRMAPGFCDPELLGKLVLVWKMNCFDVSEEGRPGSALYFLPSLMSHSCFPSAMWHADRNNNFVLRARRRIEPGEEITITYLDEEELVGTASARREHLYRTKDFWCRCSRCEAEEDASRGFACPCGGQIFAPARAEAEAEGLGSASLARALLGRRCGGCGLRVPADTASALAAAEGRLQDTLGEWTREGAERPSEEAMRSVLAEVDRALGQHALAYRLRKAVASGPPFTSARLARERAELLARCALFTSEADPGLSAAHAWTLELYAEAQLSSSCSSAEELYDAFHCLEEASQILSALFGAGHDDALGIKQKMVVAVAEVKRRLGGETAKE